MDQRRQQGASRRQGASRGLGLGQLLSGDGPGGAVRWLQDERLWPRVRQAAPGRISQRQGGLDQDLIRQELKWTAASCAAACDLIHTGRREAMLAMPHRAYPGPGGPPSREAVKRSYSAWRLFHCRAEKIFFIRSL